MCAAYRAVMSASSTMNPRNPPANPTATPPNTIAKIAPPPPPLSLTPPRLPPPPPPPPQTRLQNSPLPPDRSPPPPRAYPHRNQSRDPSSPRPSSPRTPFRRSRPSARAALLASAPLVQSAANVAQNLGFEAP